jgi:1,2-diacylglycerol 3-beta-galactosyltransferase
VSPPRRVLILTSDTGAGHRSVSNALMAAIRAQPERSLEPIDLDPFAPLPRSLGGPEERPRRSLVDRVVGLYGPVIVHAPWLWGAIFRLTNNSLALRLFAAAFAVVPLRRLRAAIERTDAAALVSVHPLANHLMVAARRRMSHPALPLMTVVTDLVDVHRWWAAPGVDQYVAGTDLAAARLRDLGIAPQRIAVLGIPIRSEFYSQGFTTREMRQRLGLDAERAMVLLMGGGDGAGRLAATAQAIARTAPARAGRLQLVVLAGRNERARRALEAQASRAWPMPARICGIVHNVAELMAAADVIVTKPGSLTISEALATGKPLVLGPPLPGQEEGNVPYVVRAGAGLAYRSPAEAAEAVELLLADPSLRWEMGQRAARLSRPRATERTLDLLQGLVLRAQAGARR